MKYLFIDRKHVQMIDGIRQVFHQPVKDSAPIIAPERPWEDNWACGDGAPIWDAERGVWRLWYVGGANFLPLYAESRNGLNWDKPALGRAPWNGSTANNIVYDCKATDPEHDSKIPHSLMVRDDLEKDSAHRFKGFSWIRETANGLTTGSFLVPFTSPNGMDWTRLAGADRIPCEDTKCLAYDSLKNRFVATVKGLSGCGVKRHGVMEMGRMVYLSMSNDFRTWTEPELILWGDEIDRELGAARIEEAVCDPDRRAPLTVKPEEYFTDIYCMPVFVYEDLYLALPVLFNQSGRYFMPSGETNQDGLSYPTLVASRDLRSWDRLSRAPFIPLSPLSNRQLFDHGFILTAPPIEIQGELFFYYTGWRFTHVSPEAVDLAGLRGNSNEVDHAVFVARMRLDGFASLQAGNEPGIVLTKPLKVTGSTLKVNVNAAQGELKVELRDALTGRAIPGYGMGDYRGNRVVWSENGKRGTLRIGPGARFEDDPEQDDTLPISEDSTNLTVRWKGGSDLSALKGREVRVFFHLRNAQLFSFWFAE